MVRRNDEERTKRLHSISKSDQRFPFEIDRDRILHSSAFHRLDGVTQIARTGEETIFHTRQQHTYKVAQIGRRLAQSLIRQHPRKKHLIDPEVIEAACLAHDLGHPPFGHAGEHELNTLVSKGDADGFEGNAQTFRVITKLSVRFAEVDGLNLTRATMAACLKYPWYKDPGDPKKKNKWGAYQSEKTDFDFAREGYESTDEQTTEAALMDWADDIAYSVHDLEEFSRCSAIPWVHIFFDGGGETVAQSARKKWFNPPANVDSLLSEAFERVFGILKVCFNVSLMEKYDGTREQRQSLRNMTSIFIDRYFQATELDFKKSQNGIYVSDEMLAEIKILKQFVASYIIETPSLSAQQLGQRKIIREVFNIITSESKSGPPVFLPKRLKYLWSLSDGKVFRFASDCICSLTEKELVAFHGRLTGVSSGSLLDPIVR